MKRLVLLGALAAFAMIPALASAKNIHHRGGVLGDSNSKITLRVATKGKDIRKISGFKASGLDIRCDGQTVDGFSFSLTGSVRTNENDNFRAKIPNVQNPNEKLRLTGKVKKKGKKVVGNIKTKKITVTGPDGHQRTCMLPKRRFVTKKN